MNNCGCANGRKPGHDSPADFVYWGTAQSCVNGREAQMRIDLSGTPFSVNTNVGSRREANGQLDQGCYDGATQQCAMQCGGQVGFPGRWQMRFCGKCGVNVSPTGQVELLVTDQTRFD